MMEQRTGKPKYWTVAKLTGKNNAYEEPKAGVDHYFDDVTGVGIGFTGERVRRRDRKRDFANTVFAFGAEKLKEIVKAAPRKYILLVNYSYEETEQAAREAKNAILGTISDEIDVLLPLFYYWTAADFFMAGDSAKPALPGYSPFSIWIDGQELDQDSKCENCPNSVGRLLLLCQPFRTTCINPPEPFLPICKTTIRYERNARGVRLNEDNLEPDGVSKLLQWLQDKPMGFELSGERKDFKDTVSRRPFENTSVETLATEWHELDSIQKMNEERSGWAETAAKTKRHRKYVCPGCLHTCSAYCSMGGGQRCEGPYYDSEFDQVIRRADPWMVHAMTLAGEHVDARPIIREWANDRTTHRVTGLPITAAAYKIKLMVDRAKVTYDARFVGIIKENSRYTPSEVPYLWLCEQLKVKPVESWEELSSEKLAGFDMNLVKALAAAFHGNAGHLTSGGGGWYNNSTMYLQRIELTGTLRIGLPYVSSSGKHTSIDIRNFGDLYLLNGFYSGSTPCDEDRTKENGLVKSLIHDTKVNAEATFILGVTRKRRIINSYEACPLVQDAIKAARKNKEAVK